MAVPIWSNSFKRYGLKEMRGIHIEIIASRILTGDSGQVMLESNLSDLIQNVSFCNVLGKFRSLTSVMGIWNNSH